MSTNHILLQILSVPPDQRAAVNWPTSIASGLPRLAFTDLAAQMKVPEKQLAEGLGLTLPKRKEFLLDAEASEGLFRVSQILSNLVDHTKWDLPACARWLLDANSSLRQRVPLGLLRSGIGFEYVSTAVARL